jgi:dihydropteroate synthase
MTGRMIIVRQKETDIHSGSAGFSPVNGEQPISTGALFKCRDSTFRLCERTHIMGILNVTPDSFHDGGRYTDVDSALRHAEMMLEAGADIIDVGGESTRPGSSGVSEEVELRRVLPVIREMVKRFDTVISIDTTKGKVAREALGEGASLINDISGLTYSDGIAEAASEYGAGLVLMHTPSRPLDMQEQTEYASLVDDILAFLGESVKKAERCGVSAESIIVDPGFGFGKTVDQNLTILKNLVRFRELGKPVMIGTSNKSFIGKITGTSQEERTEGTAATVAIGIMNGARVVRVHDVASMRRAARIADAVAGVENRGEIS